MQSSSERPRLADIGQVYVTFQAARQYAEQARRVYAEGRTIEIEEARRELTALLLDAKRAEGDTDTPERWRYRSRTTGADISARIVREGRLVVVVSISARAVVNRPRGKG